MKPKILQWISLIIAVCGGILALADTITPIASINPTLSHSWPVILVVATVVSRVAAIAADKLKEMPIVILLFATLQFSGCAVNDAYQKSVASRSIGAGGYASQGGNVGGKVVYSVTYR